MVGKGQDNIRVQERLERQITQTPLNKEGRQISKTNTRVKKS